MCTSVAESCDRIILLISFINTSNNGKQKKKKKKKFKPTRVRDGTRVDKKETHEQVPLNQLKASAT